MHLLSTRQSVHKRRVRFLVGHQLLQSNTRHRLERCDDDDKYTPERHLSSVLLFFERQCWWKQKEWGSDSPQEMGRILCRPSAPKIEEESNPGEPPTLTRGWCEVSVCVLCVSPAGPSPPVVGPLQGPPLCMGSLRPPDRKRRVGFLICHQLLK